MTGPFRGVDPTRIPGMIPSGAVPGGIMPRMPNAAGVLEPPQRPQATTILPAWYNYELPGSVDFLVKTSGSTISAANNATTAATGFSFRVSGGNRGVLKTLRATVQSAVAGMNLTFALLVDGSPVPGYSGLSFAPGAAALMVLTWSDMKVIIEENQTLTATVTEVGALGPFAVELQGQGWQTSKSIIDQFSQGVPL